MENYLGQILVFAGNFAPRGWLPCNGQILPINQNQALFSIIGTTYGGDGITNFRLPDLRGRAAVGYGIGPGLSEIVIGQSFGSETNTMTIPQMPQHTHVSIAVQPNVKINVCGGDEQDSDTPVDCFLRQTPGTNTYSGTTAPGSEMGNSPATVTIQPSGASQPINNIQPTLTLTYCIATTGIYPSRS